MKVKMIVLDLDGTLLNQHEEILEANVRILRKCMQKGIKVVLASGRVYPRMQRYLKLLNINQGYIIELNGLRITNLETKEQICFNMIPSREVARIMPYYMQYDVEVLGLFNNGMYQYISDDLYQAKIAYKKAHNLTFEGICGGPYDLVFDHSLAYPKQIRINDLNDIKEDVYKICVRAPQHTLEQIKQEVKLDNYWQGLTSANWLEVMNEGISKGNALTKLCELLSIDLADVLAFGDGENDLSMLEIVGYGVAMGNALDSIKAKCKYVTSDHNEAGISEVISYLCGISLDNQ